jgi:hypothetical protein
MSSMSKQDVRWLIGKVVACAALLALFLLLGAGGCADRPLMPKSDPDLKRNYMVLAADAAKRSYPANTPRGGEAVARAMVDPGMFNQMKVVNLSDQDWSDVELWVNEKYVIFLKSWPKGQLKGIGFKMLFDDSGNNFPIDNKETPVRKVEILREGKLYEVPMQLAD